MRTLRLRHGGTFQLSPTSRPRPIRGVQLFTADPPGFVWQGRVKLAPGLWIDARDMLASGAGSMRVLVDDIVALADASGLKLDQGSALRLLAEMVWYPTALFDARTVTWTAVDASHARATLRVGDLSVDGTFEFGADGLPIGMTAERFGDKGVLRPWGGVYRDWRTVAGMRVPFEAIVSWQLDPVYTYAHWYVDSIEYDAPGGAGLDQLASAPASPISGLAKAAMVLELVLGVGAIGGGLALMLGPHGEPLPLPIVRREGELGQVVGPTTTVFAFVPAAITVPREAIGGDRATAYVLVVVGERVERRAIEIDDWPAPSVVVRSGVQAGDLVVIDPTAAVVGAHVPTTVRGGL